MSATITPQPKTGSAKPLLQDGAASDGRPSGDTPGGLTKNVRGAANKRAAALMFVIAAAGAALMLLPLYIMLSLSLKTDAETNYNPWTWPAHPQWINYAHTWHIPGTDVTFADFFRNTILVAGLSTIGTVLSSSFVAYGFARLRFPGRDRLFLILLATMMLPSIITLIPSFIGFRYIHWVDTLYPLIVPSFFAGAFNVFLLRQFFMTIPRELDEAARLDGASYTRIYWSILLPLTKPALVTVALFAFIYGWKDLMAPLIYLSSPENQTLELGLRTFQTIRQTSWNLLMAGSMIVLLPLLVLFFLGQRYFIRGIVMQGMKD